MNLNIKYPSAAEMDAYHKGVLSPQRQHQLEMLALVEPGWQDALDGFENCRAHTLFDRLNGRWRGRQTGLALLLLFSLVPQAGEQPRISPASVGVIESGSDRMVWSDSTTCEPFILFQKSKDEPRQTPINAEVALRLADADQCSIQSMPVLACAKPETSMAELRPRNAATPAARIFHLNGLKMAARQFVNRAGHIYLTGLPASNNPDDLWTEKAITDAEYASLLTDMAAAFVEGKYTVTLRAAETLLKISPDDENALFYSGLSAKLHGLSGLSEARLRAGLRRPGGVFREESEYHLALLLVTQPDKGSEAMVLLESIAGQGGFYADRAHGMLED